MKKILKYSPENISKFHNLKKKVVLVGGCFDILHIGHLKFLEEAKKSGDILVVLLEDDKNVKRLKGKGKFIILNECVATSSRRWDREGVLYTMIRNWILISLYLIGVSSNRLKGWYREHGG